jgi:hypothetical protein
MSNFSKMTPERRSEIARMGQAALKASGNRKKWTSETAKAASLKAAANRAAKRAAQAQQPNA